MVYQILTNGIMNARLDSDHQFGAHPVSAGNQHRMFETGEIRSETTSELSPLSQHLQIESALDPLSNAGLSAIRFRQINSGAFVNM
jgi:hypothetical protein